MRLASITTVIMCTKTLAAATMAVWHGVATLRQAAGAGAADVGAAVGAAARVGAVKVVGAAVFVVMKV